MTWPPTSYLPAINTGLSYFAQFLTVAVLVRLWREDLLQTYKSFAALLTFDFVSTVYFQTALTPGTYAYGRAWMIVEAGKLLLYAAVALELYDVSLQPYPGIRRAGQWVVRISLALATVITLVLVPVDVASIADISINKVFPSFLSIQRNVILTLALFQVFVLVFLVWFPVRLSRNARLYAFLYVFFFTGKSMAVLYLLLWRTDKELSRALSAANITLYCCCLAAFALRLSRIGEETGTRSPMAFPRPNPEVLTAKLQSINARLSGYRKE